MQPTSILTIIALTAVGVVAHPPPKPTPPPPPPPTISQTISCSGGTPFCCSPTGRGDATCTKAVTECNTILICCANAADGVNAVAACVATATAAITIPAVSTSNVVTVTVTASSMRSSSGVANASSATSRLSPAPLVSSRASSRLFRGEVAPWRRLRILILVWGHGWVLMVSAVVFTLLFAG